MMDELKISLAEVSECASKIRNFNQMMYEQLSLMKKDMNDTNASWISDAGETIRSRFNQFANRFDRQKEQIDSYAKFLDQTVDHYNTLESTIHSNASSMQAKFSPSTSCFVHLCCNRMHKTFNRFYNQLWRMD